MKETTIDAEWLLTILRWREPRGSEPDLVIRRADFLTLKKSLEGLFEAKFEAERLRSQLERAKQCEVFLPMAAIGTPLNRGLGVWKNNVRAKYKALIELSEEIIENQDEETE